MRTLKADERPVSHFRADQLRAERRDRPAGGLALPKFRLGRAASEPPAEVEAEEAAPVRTPARPTPSSDVRARRAQPGFFTRMAAAAQAKDLSDPSPTRLEYRIERLWLTPYFRAFMRVGMPVLLVGGAIGLYLASPDHRAAIAGRFADLREKIENRPEFIVSLMSIDGASAPVSDAIRAMLPVKLPASSFAIDLQAMRASIEQIDAVESATLQVRTGGVLAVDVVERKPAILWRTPTSASSLEMLDATGHRVATLLDRSARSDLPVVAGEGAQLAVPEALAILKAAGPILPRVRGLVRMGDRRWDVVLDRDQRILLPEANPVQAIEQVLALNGAEDLLARDIADVDLRNSERPTVRLTSAAVEEMKKMNATMTKVAGQ